MLGVASEYDDIETIRDSVTYGVSTPKIADAVLLSIQITYFTDGNFGSLLLYRDTKYGGVFALQESNYVVLAPENGSRVVLGTSTQINKDNGAWRVFIFNEDSLKPSLVSLWTSPEIPVDDIARIKNSLSLS
jgi:hypothetical protein